MRIYSNAYELMSETARNLWEMGQEVRPKTYQNKNIEGNDDFVTKELICEQYCLTKLEDLAPLFVFTHSHDWAEAEFKERVSGMPLNPGKAWRLRREIWEEFLVGENNDVFDYTYPERINRKNGPFDNDGTVLQEVINLLKTDPDTRKAIIPIFTGSDTQYYDGSCRIPCSMYYNFLIRTNSRGEKQLNICYHQRSSDFVTHFGNDVYMAWRLMEFIASQLNINPGYLYHTIDSLHSYKRDWVKLKTSISRELAI